MKLRKCTGDLIVFCHKQELERLSTILKAARSEKVIEKYFCVLHTVSLQNLLDIIRETKVHQDLDEN